MIPLPAAQVQKALVWPDERSKLGRLLPLGGGGVGVGGAAPGTQHYGRFSELDQLQFWTHGCVYLDVTCTRAIASYIMTTATRSASVLANAGTVGSSAFSRRRRWWRGCSFDAALSTF